MQQLWHQARINDSYVKLMQRVSLWPTPKWTPVVQSSVKFQVPPTKPQVGLVVFSTHLVMSCTRNTILGDETKGWDIGPLCEYKDGRCEILSKREAGWRYFNAAASSGWLLLSSRLLQTASSAKNNLGLIFVLLEEVETLCPSFYVSTSLKSH